MLFESIDVPSASFGFCILTSPTRIIMSATSCHWSQIRTSIKLNPEILECEQSSQHWVGFCHPCHCHNNVLSLPRFATTTKCSKTSPGILEYEQIWAASHECGVKNYITWTSHTYPQITGQDSWEAVTWRIYPIHCTGYNSQASIGLDLLTSLNYMFMIHPHIISIISPQILRKPTMCSNHQQPWKPCTNSRNKHIKNRKSRMCHQSWKDGPNGNFLPSFTPQC